MTEEEARNRRAVGLVEAAYPEGRSPRWPKPRFEVWFEAVCDIDPAAVERGARRLIREWADQHGRPPQPGHLRSYAKAARR